MKKKKLFIPLIILIVIAAAAVLLISDKTFDIRINNPFIKTEKTVSSEAIIKQVRSISRMNTIEFIYKTVFPYDLLDPGTDLKKLTEQYRKGARLDFEDLETLAVYGISAEAGIDLLKEDYAFAVISSRIKAGYDFPETLPFDSVEIDTKQNSVIVKLPDVRITEVIIEDSDSSIYGYPDLDISPEQWKTLTSIISRLVKEKAEKKGILGEAEKRGRELIRELLLSAGFTEVSFE